MDNIQQKTAQTLLQQPEEVTIAGTKYQVPQPTLGTLILVSQEIAHIPISELDKEKAIGEAFQNASFGKHVARALALMIVGASHPKQSLWQRIKGLLHSRKRKLKELTNSILYQMSIQEAGILFIQLLGKMQTTDFFMLITFLHEANMLKPTRKVSETTAYGR